VARFEKMGDLFEPVLELKQKLPDPKATAAAVQEPDVIEIAAQADETPAPRKAAHKPSAKKSGAGNKKAKA